MTTRSNDIDDVVVSAAPLLIDEDDDDTSGEDTADVRHRFGLPRLSGGAWLIRFGAVIVLTVERTFLAVNNPGPAIFADETGTWAVARYVAGVRPTINMLQSPPYSVLGGTVLAPIVWVFDSFQNQYRAFLFVSSLCAVLCGFVAAALVRVATSAGERTQTAAFAIGVLYPATVLAGSFSWIEYLTPLWVLFTAYCFTTVALRVRDAPQWWIASGLLAGSSPALHGRFGAIPLLFLALVIAAALRWMRAEARTRAMWLTPVIGVAAAAAAYLFWRAVSNQVFDAVWLDLRNIEREVIRQRLGEAEFYPILGAYVIGHLWYALAATCGLAGVGIGWCAVRLVRPARPGDRTVASIVVILAGSILLTSAVFNAANHSTDNVLASLPEVIYYGRYGDGATLLLAVVGVAWLGSMARGVIEQRRWVALGAAMAGLLLTGVAVHDWVGHVTDGWFFGPRVPGVWLFPFDGPRIPSIMSVTVLAMAAFAVTVILLRRPKALGSFAAIILVSMSIFATRSVHEQRLQYNFDRLHLPVPFADDAHDIAYVASDVSKSRDYIGVVTEAYFIAPKGWTIREVDMTSAELVAMNPLPDDAGLLIVYTASGFQNRADLTVLSTWSAFSTLLVQR